MAIDSITAIGLASAIFTFVDFGIKLVRRLEELSEAGEVPKAFREIEMRLPVIIATVNRTKDAARFSSLKEEEALSSIIRSCHDQVKQLEEILQKFTAEKGESSWKKGFKATLSLLEETRVQKIESALRENIQILTFLNVTSTEISVQSIPKRVIILPFERDRQFVGREHVLASIKDLFKSQRRVAITGIGGVGKSQIAIEYSYRFMEKNPEAHIFWVYGGNPARFCQGYKKIARDLSLPSWDDPDTDTIELVLNWFSKADQPYLLVVDNADNMADYWPRKAGAESQTRNLSAFLPETDNNGFLLITSRDNRIGARLMRKSKPISMESMTSSEAKRLFLSKAEDYEGQCGDTDLDTLLRELDYLPLAITQAAAFISENCICVREYLSALKGNDALEYLDEEWNDSRRDEESVNSVLRTWKLSFDQISAQKPRAAELLSLMAMFDRQSIPKALLRVPETITSLGTLQSFNLISSRTDTNSFQMHRLVQRFVQFSLEKSETIEKWQEAAVKAVSEVYPTSIGVSDWLVCENLAPHVQTVLSYQLSSVPAQLCRGHLLCWAADYDVERGLYDQAFHRAVESATIFGRFVSGTDPRLAAAQWQFGRLQYYQSRSKPEMDVAIVALNEALLISEKPSIIYADTCFELAHIYYEHHDREKSLEMAEACWTTYKILWGPNDVRVLDHMHDHALKLAMFGNEEAGIKMWQEVLALCDGSNASKNTKLIFTFRSRAGIAEFQGDFKRAEIFYKNLIALCESTLGKDHVTIFDYRLSLAEQVMRQGRLDEARELSQSILASSENKHEWRIIVSCFEMIAEISNRKTRYDEEEDYRIRCLDTYTKMLGSDNHETIDAMDGLAKALTLNQKYDKAQALYSSIFEWREKHLGDAHPDTLEALERVGIAMMHQGDDENAATQFSKVLRRTVTPSLRTLHNSCAALWNQEKWEELEARSRRALTLEGADARFNGYLIAALERQQGRVEEALAPRASTLSFEQPITESSLETRKRPEQPPRRETEDRRFGRIIHPRVYSS